MRGGGNGSFERAISSYIWNTSGYYFAFQMYAGTALQLLGHLAGVNLVVYVDFPDGSSLQMRIAGLGENGEVIFEYVPETAVDSDNNNIPDSQTTFSTHTGTYYTDNSINDFLAYAASMGIPITGSSSGGGTYVVECTNEGGRTVCKLKKLTS